MGLILVNLSSIAFAIVAAAVLISGNDGWGWFLLLSFFALHTVKD